MSMGRRDRERQSAMWLATNEVARSPGHPFYVRLNEVLKSAGFDQRVEELCASFYSKKQSSVDTSNPAINGHFKTGQ